MVKNLSADNLKPIMLLVSIKKMIVISGKNLKKEYGADIIFDNVTFAINKGDKVGIVGPNGCGKTTLLNVIGGDLSASDGTIFISSDVSLGYLRQKSGFDSEDTVIDTMFSVIKPLLDMEKRIEELSHIAAELSGDDQAECLREYDRLLEKFQKADGYKKKSECIGILSGMAFDESYYNKSVKTLSGGEKTRLALGMLLFRAPNVLFLDEPTNHLDIGTVKWLEQYLKSYKGTVVTVSHDRYFLNETVNRIFDMSGGGLKTYDGNYEVYVEKKKAMIQSELSRYQKQQKEIAKQEEIIRKFKGRGTEKLAKRAASREKRLAHTEKLESPVENRERMKIHFKEDFRSGNDVVFAENLSKSFGYGSNERELFSGVNFDIKRGEKICIVGANGIGKTSLLRIINGETKASSGIIRTGHNVEIAYYDQEQQNLNDENTVFDEMKDIYRLYGDAKMRSILGRFLFKGDDVFSKVGNLSGGERARLSLLKMILSGANLLLLDEPTNHLDLDSKEVFEDALLDFTGTAIIISHDRYLLSKIPNRIFELEKDGIKEYQGKYDYYIRKKEEILSGSRYLESLNEAVGKTYGGSSNEIYSNSGTKKHITSKEKKTVDAATERLLNKQREREERRYMREQERLEKEIEALEKRISEIEKEMCSEEVLSDFIRLDALNEELKEANDKLTKNYQKWLN